MTPANVTFRFYLSGWENAADKVVLWALGRVKIEEQELF